MRVVSLLLTGVLALGLALPPARAVESEGASTALPAGREPSRAPAGSDGAASRRDGRPAKTKKGKRGGRRVWVALGAVGVGGGVFLLLKDRDKAPLPGTINVTPAGGVTGVTEILFEASGSSDPDGDPLVLAWDFGDGAQGSGEKATHTYATSGTFTVTLTVSDGKKDAKAVTSVSAKSLGGVWQGQVAGLAFPTVVSLTQSGSRLSGTISLPGAPAGFAEGVVAGAARSPLQVVFTNSFCSLCAAFTFSGTVDASVSRLTGVVQGSGFTGQSWVLTRQ